METVLALYLGVTRVHARWRRHRHRQGDVGGKVSDDRLEKPFARAREAILAGGGSVAGASSSRLGVRFNE